MQTAGESHGPYEVCVVEGIPAGLRLDPADVDVDLVRRQQGYGRGARMAVEADKCEFVAGVRLGLTLGSPIAILVSNKDHHNWVDVMRPGSDPAGALAATEASAVPRPGHADFAGMAKFHQRGIRSVLERASARETVARVAGGAVCKRLLREAGVTIRGRVVSLGGMNSDAESVDYARPDGIDWAAVEASSVACDDGTAEEAMRAAVDAARTEGESLGGVFEIWAWGVCPGLGSYCTFEGRLDAALLGAVGSIPAVKGVEVGPAFANSQKPGSQVHDALVLRDDEEWRGVGRLTNRAGGLEGGVTNGMPIVIRAAMKPIPTMATPLPSVDLATMQVAPAHIERSDITAVPAARVVGEAMVAYVLAGAYLDKFGGDTLDEMLRAVSGYEADLEERGLWRRS